jgi:membrane protease YdiL (CAAX protease family)
VDDINADGVEPAVGAPEPAGLVNGGAWEPGAQATTLPPPLPPGLNRPGGWDLLSVLAIVWAAEFLLGIAIVAALAVKNGGMPDSGGFEIEPWAAVATAPFSVAVTVGACWYFACKRHHRSFSDGLYIRAVAGAVQIRSVLLGLLGALVGGGLISRFSTGESLMSELVVRPASEDPEKLQLYYPLLIFAVLMPLLEELYYRGFIFSVLQRLLNSAWAMGIIIIWFGAIHAPQLAGDPVGIPVVATMGALFTWLRYKHDSIVPAIICHCVYNTTLVTFTIIEVTIHNG